MTMRFDDKDRAALRTLDADVDSNNEVAAIADVNVEITRHAHEAGDQFWLRLTFPSDEQLDVKLRRNQLLERIDVGAGES